MKAWIPLLFCHAALAQDPFAESASPEPTPSQAEPAQPSNVAVLVEYIAIDHLRLSKLLHKHRQEDTDSRLRQELQKLIEDDFAEVVECTQIVTRSGLTNRSRSVV